MILVGMGADHGVELLHTHVLQIGDHQIAVFHIAAVDDHEFPVTFEKGTVRLPHIEEVNGEGGGLAGGEGVAGQSDQRLQGAASAKQQAQDQQPGEEFSHFRPSTVRPLLFFAFFC